MTKRQYEDLASRKELRVQKSKAKKKQLVRMLGHFVKHFNTESKPSVNKINADARAAASVIRSGFLLQLKMLETQSCFRLLVQIFKQLCAAYFLLMSTREASLLPFDLSSFAPKFKLKGKTLKLQKLTKQNQKQNK